MAATVTNLERVVHAVFKSGANSRPFVKGRVPAKVPPVGQGVARIDAVQQSIEYQRIISSMPA